MSDNAESEMDFETSSFLITPDLMFGGWDDTMNNSMAPQPPNYRQLMLDRTWGIPWELFMTNTGTGTITFHGQYDNALDLVTQWVALIGHNDYDRFEVHINDWLSAGDPNAQIFLDSTNYLLPPASLVQAYVTPRSPPTPVPAAVAPITEENMRAGLLAYQPQQRPPSPPVSHPWGPAGFPTAPTDADWAALAQFWTKHLNRAPPGWIQATDAGNPRAALPAPASRSDPYPRAPAPRNVPAGPSGPITTNQPAPQHPRVAALTTATPAVYVHKVRNFADGRVRPILCPFQCGAKYLHRGYLLRHLKDKHPGYLDNYLP